MEVDRSPWGSKADILDLLKEIEERMIPHVQKRMLDECHVAITKDQAQDVVHQALDAAERTFDSNRGKKFKSWVWFKLDGSAVPGHIRKSTYKVRGRIVPREESLDHNMDAASRIEAPREASGDGANYIFLFNQIRSKLRKDDKKMWDLMRDVSDNGNGAVKRFKATVLQRTIDEHKMGKEEAEKAWRRISYTYKKFADHYKRLED